MTTRVLLHSSGKTGILKGLSIEIVLTILVVDQKQILGQVRFRIKTTKDALRNERVLDV